MNLKMINDQVTNEITTFTFKPGNIIDIEPRFNIYDLYIHVSLAKNIDEFEKFFLNTLGGFSIGYWSEADQFRFNKKTLELEGVLLAAVGSYDDNIEEEIWRKNSLKTGMLFLDFNRDFEVGITWRKRNSYNILEDTLITYINDIDALSQDFVSLQIAKDFTLLFIEESFIGWRLENVSKYVTIGYDNPITSTDLDNVVKKILERYLLLIWYIEDEKNDVIPSNDTYVYSECVSIYAQVMKYSDTKDDRVQAFKYMIEKLLYNHILYEGE